MHWSLLNTVHHADFYLQSFNTIAIERHNVMKYLYLNYSGTDPEETILQAFKILDADNKGVINKN